MQESYIKLLLHRFLNETKKGLGLNLQNLFALLVFILILLSAPREGDKSKLMERLVAAMSDWQVWLIAAIVVALCLLIRTMYLLHRDAAAAKDIAETRVAELEERLKPKLDIIFGSGELFVDVDREENIILCRVLIKNLSASTIDRVKVQVEDLKVVDKAYTEIVLQPSGFSLHGSEDKKYIDVVKRVMVRDAKTIMLGSPPVELSPNGFYANIVAYGDGTRFCSKRFRIDIDINGHMMLRDQ
jgi:hypothetical protein